MLLNLTLLRPAHFLIIAQHTDRVWWYQSQGLIWHHQEARTEKIVRASIINTAHSLLSCYQTHGACKCAKLLFAYRDEDEIGVFICHSNASRRTWSRDKCITARAISLDIGIEQESGRAPISRLSASFQWPNTHFTCKPHCVDMCIYIYISSVSNPPRWHFVSLDAHANILALFFISRQTILYFLRFSLFEFDRKNSHVIGGFWFSSGKILCLCASSWFQ